MSQITTEVMIVGAGPAGLMLACDLARRGVPFRIADRSEAPSTLSRAVGLQARTLEALDDIGLAEAFLENGTVVTAVRSYSNGRLHHVFELNEPSEQAPYPYLLIVEQHVTESILLRELARLGGGVDRGVELRKLSDEPDQVQSWLRTSAGDMHARSSYLVGCDGPNSTVRRLRRFEYTASPSELLYYVADVELEWALPAQEIVWLVEGESEVVAVPLPGQGRYRLNLWKPGPGPLAQPAFGALETPLDLATWRSILERLAPCDVNLTRVRSSLAYRTGHGVAESFQEGRTFLAGDAAHAIPHCTAQGLNLGLQDAYNLGWKLGMVVKGEAPPELLSSYQHERRSVARAALASITCEPALMGRATHLESREALDRWSGLNLDYRHSLGGFSTLAGPGVQAGDRAPDGQLTRAGSPVSLYEILKGLSYHLLVFSDFEDKECDQLVLELRSRYRSSIRVARVGPAGDALLDKDSRLHSAYAATHGDMVLIRPDRFIAARASRSNRNELLGYLSQHLTPALL